MDTEDRMTLSTEAIVYQEYGKHQNLQLEINSMLLRATSWHLDHPL